MNDDVHETIRVANIELAKLCWESGRNNVPQLLYYPNQSAAEDYCVVIVTHQEAPECSATEDFSDFFKKLR